MIHLSQKEMKALVRIGECYPEQAVVARGVSVIIDKADWKIIKHLADGIAKSSSFKGGK